MAFSLRLPSLAMMCIGSMVVAGCGSGQDREIETSLGAVATHRAEHLHYPVMGFGDFGDDNHPIGITVDGYGPYVHESTKFNPNLMTVSASVAGEKLERSFEHVVQAVAEAGASTPPPKPPLPSNPDWKAAPHPKDGFCVIVSRCGNVTHSFTIPIDLKAHSNVSEAIASIRPALASDAAKVVSDGVKAQNAALIALETPRGFTLCTEELLKNVDPSHPGDPHLSGGPLLITPMDRTLAIKAFEHTISRLLDMTSKIKPPPALAHLTATGPGFDQLYVIPLDDPKTKQAAVNTVLRQLGDMVDKVNKQ